MSGWKGGQAAAEERGHDPARPAGATDMLGGLADHTPTPWRRSLTRIRVVAVLCSLLAGGVVFAIFNGVARGRGEARPEKLLIGSIDMGIAYREQGQTQARADIASGLLQLLFFGPDEAPTPEDAARDERLKRRYGVARVRRGDAPTPQTQAYVDGYNRVVKAEIKRRHGAPALAALMHELEGAQPGARKAGQS
jgi:hypothetical protein